MRNAALFILASLLFGYSQASEPGYSKRWTVGPRVANWTALLTQPSAFVSKSHTRLRKRPEGYRPSSTCTRHVGLSYLDHIRRSGVRLCGEGGGGGDAPRRDLLRQRQRQEQRLALQDPEPLCDAGSGSCRSSVDCYTAPFLPVGNASKASVSFCVSRNLLLDSCAFMAGRRPGSLSKQFPLPARGAVRLACELADSRQLAGGSSGSSGGGLRWLRSIHQDVWWGPNTTRDDAAVRAACAPGSPHLVSTPTLFVMRDRHANYAHELEVVSMAFSFLAALEPADVAEQGMQVVIVDQAPPTGFLETWARISHPHRLRVLAHEPFPPGTCFRSALHLHTFAAGIGYNTNPATTRCESPVVTGLSHWLRQLYGQADPAAPPAAVPSPTAAATAVAGPAAAAAGLRELRPPAGGIVVKNVVWLSRRNLEMVRLLVGSSAVWKSMRLVRNEEEVVAGLAAAVQEWNAESCLLRRFNRGVKTEYERSLTHVHPIHGGNATSAGNATSGDGGGGSSAAATPGTPLAGSDVAAGGRRAALQTMHRALLGGALLRQRRRALEDAAAAAMPASGGGADGDGDADDDDGAGGAAANATAVRPPYMIYNNIVDLQKLWALDAEADAGCRHTNVLFKFVEGDFADMSYHSQLHTVFQTGVLAGVHGAGLAHGFFLPPGQSAVLQLLGESYEQVTACNVFRNMAAGAGNHYADVRYKGVDVDVGLLKQATKRAMDFVASKTMEAQLRRSGSLRLVLVDQNHFSVVVPPQEKCPVSGMQKPST